MFKTKETRFKGTAHKSDDPNLSIIVELEKGPLDMKTGEQITSVGFANDETSMAEAIEEIGPNNVRRILRDGEKVECHVGVQYNDWE